MLKVENLKTEFKVGNNTVKAVDNISFEVKPRQVVGIVGESGSGKSVTSLSILNLLGSNASVSGGVYWKGQDILSLAPKKLSTIRGSEIGLIFQNPLASLNPVFSIGNQMMETIQLHHKVNKKEAKAIAVDLLRKVNIPDAESRLNDYPHQFSLGMCQRIMIAITLSMRPKLLIADEPTASLDVTIQAQILKLLDNLKKEYDMSILLISHDLGVIAQHCDEILIMYLGSIVEQGPTREIFKSPKHPYTKALLDSIPIPDPDQRSGQNILRGDIPSPVNLPSGCRFHTRCPKVFGKCNSVVPTMKKVGKQLVSCLLYQ